MTMTMTMMTVMTMMMMTTLIVPLCLLLGCDTTLHLQGSSLKDRTWTVRTNDRMWAFRDDVSACSSIEC